MNRTYQQLRGAFALAFLTLFVVTVPAQAFRMVQSDEVGVVSAGDLVRCDDSGGFLHWTNPEITVFLNPILQGKGKGPALESALESWSNVSGADHELTYGGEMKGLFGVDGINSVNWRSVGPCFDGSCLALTVYVLEAGQEIVEVDIQFSNSVTWGGANSLFDTESVMAHEVGHLLGIHHSEVTSSPQPTMRQGYDFTTNWRSLELDDKEALRCAQDKYPFPINEPPVANFTDSGGLEHSFNGGSSSDDEGIASYEWTFPGGIMKSGQVVSHFFERYGAHTVTLTVTDTDGEQSSRTRTINLAEPTITPLPGLWNNPARNGHGISFHRNNAGNYVLIWYTYTENGEPTWYISNTGAKIKSTWSQPLLQTSWNGSSATSTVVGHVELVFDDSGDAWFSWTLDGDEGVEEEGGERFQHLHGGDGRDGIWSSENEGEDGWGFDVAEENNRLVATVYFYEGSQPRWVLAQGDSSADATMSAIWVNGDGLCPSCTGGDSDPPDSQPAGSIRLEIENGSSTTGEVSTSIVMPSQAEWNRTDLPIRILTQP